MAWNNGGNLAVILMDLENADICFLLASVPARFSKPRSAFTTVLPDITILRNPIGAVKLWNAHKN